MYFKCTCGVGSSIKLKYDWLMCSGLTFRENTKCFLNTLQNHFDDTKAVAKTHQTIFKYIKRIKHT